MRTYVRIDLAHENTPGAIALLKFRRLLEINRLMQRFFSAINTTMTAKELLMRSRTIVDTTIINFTHPIKNCDGKPDGDVHQIKKVNQYYCTMNARSGADADSGPIHTVTIKGASMVDIAQAALPHGNGK